MEEEFIEISQDEAVLSKACPEDLIAVKPEEVSYYCFIVIHYLSILLIVYQGLIIYCTNWSIFVSPWESW